MYDLHSGRYPWRFGRIEAFCKRFGTSKDDVMIILGDAGINFSGGIQDIRKKKFLESLPVTIFAIHGDHEQRPQTIDSYREKMWHGGVVYWEEEYPSPLLAKDGEVFELDGKQAIVMGVAYSIDKMVRLMFGYGWWPDEQPSDEVKRCVESRLEKLGWKVDVVLSHTTSLKYEVVRYSWLGLTRVRWISLRRNGWIRLRTSWIMGSSTASIIIWRRRLTEWR